ncbi:MAG: bifunctional UDP-N-acetylglucosamine diphosphorylase/glucosamine-1-phosphate N-acetyltransferase GlmU [Firmicutes bacterium]|nr:bifunctional UDP-N-acetylglucosamine diphosphorylase/glucosamine-1-phosphate N-acetyltransferase GlmU [Bacillota bacterium]
MEKLKVIILAAGQGTRMKSKIPKVLHKVLDKTMIDYVIDAAEKAGCDDICAIIGHQSAMVKAVLAGRVKTALQKEQLGTGHAVMQAGDFIKDGGNIVILCGDTPLITAETINKLNETHCSENNDVTVISAIAEDATGYGRIVKDNGGRFIKIVEHKDCNSEELKIKEYNTGVYIFKSAALNNALSKLTNNNSQGEYYLTDALEIIKNDGGKVGVMTAENESEFIGVNSKLQLSQAAKTIRKRINENLMINGVTIEDPDNTYIGQDVEIEPDTIILPGCVLEGKTKIGTDCIIGPNTMISGSIIHDAVIIKNSTLVNSEVDNFTTVGPYAYLRPNSKIGEHVKIGDFVEVKNSNIDDGTKVSHLTYIGDSDVGKNINFGCGTVTVNYDGKNKFRTTIGDNAFIGCNTNLVAPVTVEENAYIAAGSTITNDVPESALSIARARQVNKPEWRKKMGK